MKIWRKKKLLKKNAIPLVLPIEEISLQPDLSFPTYSESRGVVWALHMEGWKMEILASNLGWEDRKKKRPVVILDFIYHGEANIYQEDLDGFLSLAGELQLKGGSKQEADEPIMNPSNMNSNKPTIPKQETNVYPNSTVDKINEKSFMTLIWLVQI